MSWHTPAYTAGITNAANTDVAALTDQVLTIFNNHFLLRKPMQLLAAMAMSPLLTKCRFDSPTLRYYGNPYIRPIIGALVPGGDPQIAKYLQAPFVLPQGEEIAIQATSTVATSEQFTAALWLQENYAPLPGGNLYPIRFTSTTAAVANKWSTLAYTLDTGLPVGQYALCYAAVQSANGQVARFIFDEQSARPGFPMVTALTQRGERDFEKFALGVAGYFRNDALPRLEVLCNGADASFEGYLWVNKVAG